MSNGINEVCYIKNRFQEPQAGWNFILPDGSGIPMIIDSGATFSFLSRGAWQKTRKLMKPVDFNIQVSTQVRNTILGYVEDITFKHPPDTIHFDKLLVVEGDEIGLYLNFLTLNQLGASIDFNTGVLDINLQKLMNQMSMIEKQEPLPPPPPPPQPEPCLQDMSLPQMPFDNMYGIPQNPVPHSYPDNNINIVPIENPPQPSDTRVLIPVPRENPQKRSCNRNKRSRDRRNRISNKNTNKTVTCFLCKKQGHDGKNCPNNKETLKVETHFASGKNEQEKHKRNPQLIPVSANAANRNKKSKPKSQQQMNNQRGDNNNSNNSNSNRAQRRSEQAKSNVNLVQVPQMNATVPPFMQQPSQNSQFNNMYSPPNYPIMNPNYMNANQQLHQVPQSNFGNPVFNTGYNRFM